VRRATALSALVLLNGCGILISADDLLKVDCAEHCTTPDGGGGGAGPAADARANESSADRSSGEKEASSDTGVADGAWEGADGRRQILQHVIFVTSRAYSGNFVLEANLLAKAQVSGWEGGPFTATEGTAAADALCQYHARTAGLSGKFIGVLSAASAQDSFSRITDADGPWALPNGTPVVDHVSELTVGQLHQSIDVDERGAPTTSDWTWAGGWPDWNCNVWASSAATDGGTLWGSNGQTRTIGPFFFDRAYDDCTAPFPIYCLQVGPGGAANTYPSVPANGKLAFVTGTRPANFALTYAMGLGRTADAPALAHEAADAICSAEAASAGVGGTFRAWISTTAMGAGAYFMSHQMVGPWFRSDGFMLASNLVELTSADGIRAQIALRANGTFATDLTLIVMSGDDGTGQIGSDNCQDFTSRLATDKTTRGRIAYKGPHWASWGTDNLVTCDQLMPIYCFQE
jgi:hypothetical protein